jgi:hypothetical protein
MNADSLSKHNPGAALGLCVLALIVFVFGVIAPLTPSHGLPSLWSLLTFAVAPFAMVAFASRFVTSRIARFACYLEAGAILGFTLYLVVLESGALRS